MLAVSLLGFALRPGPASLHGGLSSSCRSSALQGLGFQPSIAFLPALDSTPCFSSGTIGLRRFLNSRNWEGAIRVSRVLKTFGPEFFGGRNVLSREELFAILFFGILI